MTTVSDPIGLRVHAMSISDALGYRGQKAVGGNLFYRELPPDQRIEINVLLPREGPASGLRPTTVPGVGQVDTLPELRFALMSPALVLDVEADLGGGELIKYQTQIPDVEAATVLKAHSWRDRRSEKDLADLHSLLEIREAHRLNEGGRLSPNRNGGPIAAPVC